MIRRLLPLIVLLETIPLYAQSSIVVSPVVSFDFGRPLFINRAPGILNPITGNATATSSFSDSYGIGAQILFPSLIGPLDLIGRLQGYYTQGNFDFSGYSISGIDRKIVFELRGEWPLERFNVSVGPTISYSISHGISELDPQGRSITPTDAAAAGTQLGLSAGIAWNIDFPIRPELNSHLDLTELSDAGASALSFGITLSYSIGSASASLPDSDIESPPEISASPPARDFRKTPIVTPHLNFLVNRSELLQWVPLEKVETRVKEFAMVDSDNAPPRTSQWIVESYHLPHIAISSEIDRDAGGELVLSNGSHRLASFEFPRREVPGLTFDTILDLTALSQWENGSNFLNINDTNRIKATLRSIAPGTDTVSAYEELVLPPIDTSRVANTVIRKEFRFLLSSRYSEFKDENSYLELLLDRIREVLQMSDSCQISLFESKAIPSDLDAKVLHAIGNRIVRIQNQDDPGNKDAVLVVIDL